jgi:hypothetical protein
MSTCAAAVTSFFSPVHVLFCVASLCVPLLSSILQSLVKHCTTKSYWGVEAYLHIFITPTLDRGDWSTSHLGRLTPEPVDKRKT